MLMFDIPGDQSAVWHACLAIVEQLIAERDWQLIVRDEWARQTFQRIIGGSETDLRRAAIYIYSQALYAACSGEQGEQRRELGYGELFRYLYDHARKRYPLLGEDIAQQAVELTYKRFAQCRSPATFLAFTLQQVLAAARSIRPRRASEREVSGPNTRLHSDSFYRLTHDVDLAAPIIDDELRAKFAALSTEFLRKHPRAGMQLDALRLKYIDGLDEATISRRLAKPIASVYVLRARALEKLRAEPEWRALAVEFGVLPEDQ